jgi:uncharacterized membrane protein
MSEEPRNETVTITQRIDAPAGEVVAYVDDFRNAEGWMVGVSGVEQLSEDLFKVTLDGPVGKLRPEVRVLERSDERFRWEYASGIEGGGEVTVAPAEDAPDSSCNVVYTGEFRLGGALASRAARFVGVDRFAKRMGERSLDRLKEIMEEGR